MFERALARLLRDSAMRRAALVAAIGLLTWVAFFDSHSILRRVQWYTEVQQLEAENEALMKEIEHFRSAIEAGLSDAQVEEIARTRYGMRRPGESVYRVQSEQ